MLVFILKIKLTKEKVKATGTVKSRQARRSPAVVGSPSANVS